MKKLITIIFTVSIATTMLTASNVKLASGLNPADFDTIINNKPVKLYTLKNPATSSGQAGMEVSITNYGGRVVAICVPDKDGKLTDVVLGYDNIHEYADNDNTPSDYGSSVGRYANRIGSAKFSINGTEYKLRQNDGDNCLHGGGPTGWMNQVYDAKQIGDSVLQLTIVGADGENGFPGTVKATTTYKLNADNALDITWDATTDKETVINQTNHSYFNLNGDFNNVGTDMILYLNADSFTVADDKYIPTGEIKSVKNTPFDFTTPKVIKESMGTDFDQMKKANGGIDHNFCLNTKDDDTQVCASLYSPKTGIMLEMYTNEPGVQCYTANFQGIGNEPNIKHKGGKYPQYVSVCLESQKFPDSPNKYNIHGWELSDPFVKPGQTYHSHCKYAFSVK